MNPLRTDPVNRHIIEDFLKEIFPGVTPKYSPNIGGHSWEIGIWKFWISISFNTAATSYVDTSGNATVSMSYKPDDKRINVSRIPIKQENVTCAGDLWDVLEKCRHYLTGITAAIEIALTKPSQNPETLKMFTE